MEDLLTWGQNSSWEHRLRDKAEFTQQFIVCNMLTGWKIDNNMLKRGLMSNSSFSSGGSSSSRPSSRPGSRHGGATSARRSKGKRADDILYRWEQHQWPYEMNVVPLLKHFHSAYYLHRSMEFNILEYCYDTGAPLVSIAIIGTDDGMGWSP